MTQRNQSLDLLRGVAVLLVVLVHCAISATGNVPGLTAFAHEHGERGVQLFFIVSGYTMMLTFGAKVDPRRSGRSISAVRSGSCRCSGPRSCSIS